MSLGLRLHERGVRQRADLVEAARVPRLLVPTVRQVGEREARLRIGPGVRASGAAVAERARRRDRAEPPNVSRRAAHVRTERPVHWDAEALVDPIADLVAGHELDQAGAE